MASSALNLPRLPRGYIPRQRLDALMDDVLARPLLILDVPQRDLATQMVADWCARRSAENEVFAVWASLPDEASSMTQLANALDNACEAVGSHLPESRRQGDGDDRRVKELIALLADEANRQEKHLVVVIDALTSRNKDVAAFVDRMSASLPLFAHLIVMCSDTTSLPLALYLAVGRCSVISSDDFLFTEEEASTYLSSALDIELSFASIKSIMSMTLGHLFALRLVAATLSRSSNFEQAIDELDRGTAPLVTQYVEESLQLLSGKGARSATEHAYFNGIGRDADDALFGSEALHRFENVRETGLYHFDANGAARTIPLYAAALKRSSCEPERDRASALRWYIGKGMYEHALQISFDDDVWEQFLEAAGSLTPNSVQLIVQAAFRGATVRHCPCAERVEDRLHCIVLAASSLSVDDPQQAMTMLECGSTAPVVFDEEVEHEIGLWASMLKILVKGQAGDVHGGLRCIEEITSHLPESSLCLRSWIAKCTGTVLSRSDRPQRSERHFEESIKLAKKSSDPLVVVLSSYQLARRLVSSGSIGRAESVLNDAHASAQLLPSDLPAIGILDIGHARAHIYRGEIQQAFLHTERAIRQLQGEGNAEFRVDALIVEAQIAALNGDAERSRELLLDAIRLASRHRSNHAQALAECELAMLQARIGEYDSALRRIEDLRELELREDFAAQIRIRIARARALIGKGECSRSLAELEEIAPQLALSQSVSDSIEAGILRAAACKRESEDEAAASLRSAVRLAAGEGITLPFLLEQSIASNLMESESFSNLLAQSIDGSRIAGFIERLGIRLSDSKPKGEQKTVLQPLSRREREVANLLARKMSYKEIADFLGISKNTVHVHCNSIYAKLGVRGKREVAVALDQNTRQMSNERL